MCAIGCPAGIQSNKRNAWRALPLFSPDGINVTSKLSIRLQRRFSGTFPLFPANGGNIPDEPARGHGP